jgi:hypothetical protein
MFRINYKANLSDQLGKVIGPNLFGEYLMVVGQAYDLQMNRTTLTLKIARFENG